MKCGYDQDFFAYYVRNYLSKNSLVCSDLSVLKNYYSNGYVSETHSIHLRIGELINVHSNLAGDEVLHLLNRRPGLNLLSKNRNGNIALFALHIINSIKP